MSKSRKDGVNWKRGPEALLQAARADHEANADDYARVEAELARRLDAGGSPKRQIERAEPASTAKLNATFARSSVTKLWIGALLLAAGSFAVLQSVQHARERKSAAESATEASPPQSALATNAADSNQQLDTAPVAAATELPATPRPQLRPDAVARVAPSRPTLRSSALRHASGGYGSSAVSDSSRTNEEGSHQPAAIAMPASTASSAPKAASRRASAESNVSELSEPSAHSVLNSSVTRKQSPAPATQAELPSAPTAPDHETSNRPATTAPTNSTPQTRVAPPSLDARAELALVERMHAAMRAAKPTEALELCAEHEKRWPRGVFAQEREAVAAIASCALRSNDAAKRAQLFLRNHPRAPMAPRVTAACAPLSAATKPGSTH